MTSFNKSAEGYRQLAIKFRQTARRVSAENERADLLARAKVWDLIAERLEPAPRRSKSASSPDPGPMRVLTGWPQKRSLAEAGPLKPEE